MFTGLVQGVGVVAAAEPTPTGRRLVVRAPIGPRRASPGDSVAVAGVCLTVVSAAGEDLSFDVVPETLSRTTLGALGPGRRVNIEHALALGDPLGGHMVPGHVLGTGVVERVTKEGEYRVRIRLPDGALDAAAPKGSIVIDGVSLTIAALDAPAACVEVALIPETLARTTLGSLGPGDAVNVEMDPIAMLVAEHVRRRLDAMPRPRADR